MNNDINLNIAYCHTSGCLEAPIFIAFARAGKEMCSCKHHMGDMIEDLWRWDSRDHLTVYPIQSRRDSKC